MPLRLHIFEERYRQMMRDCEERGTGFGVVAIRAGTEVGPAAQPHEVGTLAQLRHVEQLADGRYNLLVVGASRYRIGRLSTARPYLVGEVDYLEDSAGDTEEAGRLARRVAAAFRAHAVALRELADDKPDDLELPEDPELLSYLVSATIQVETVHKQRLLEIDSAEERLRVCLELLRREAVLLDRRLARRDTPIATVSLN
jgi:Lon protease-like protein